MALDSYLFKRKNSQHWQLRWMVPKNARLVVGKTEFTKSLGVTNRAEAEALAYPYLAKWQAQVKNAVNPSIKSSSAVRVINQQEFEEYVAMNQFEWGKEGLPGWARKRVTSGMMSISGQRDHLRRQENLISQRIFLNDVDQYLGPIEFHLNNRGIGLPDEPAQRLAMAHRAALMMRDTVSHALAAMDAQTDAFQPSEFIRKAKTRAGSKAKAGESIIELFDRYGAQRLVEKRKRQDTVDQDRKVVEQFAEFVGKERAVASITAADVRDWRDTVADLPPTFRKLKANAGLTMREAAAKARLLKLKGVSPTTINKYLSTVSPFLTWCRQNSYLETNPCQGLFFDLQKLKKRRPPFTTAQLNQILQSPLFLGFLKNGKEFLPGNNRADDWRYWIPLVCMFTGARIGEVAQLTVDDVGKQDGFPYLLIRHDEEAGLSTKSGYNRPAAIHPMLITTGFLAYVERQRQRADADGDQQLFPDLQSNERGQAGKVSRFWRNYLLRIGLKDGADGFGSHSFRHTMADQLRLAGYLDDEIEVALGHNQVSVTSGYGTVRQGTVARLAKMMADVKFAGVDFACLADR